MGSENKLITAVGMAAVQKVFQKPFQQLGMQTSIQFVDDENSFPSLLQLCKGREEIQKPLRTFGFFIQLKSNVFAVQVFMNGEELFENQFIISIRTMMSLLRKTSPGRLNCCLISLNNPFGKEESMSASSTVSKWSMPVPKVRINLVACSLRTSP